MVSSGSGGGIAIRVAPWLVLEQPWRDSGDSGVSNGPGIMLNLLATLSAPYRCKRAGRARGTSYYLRSCSIWILRNHFV